MTSALTHKDSYFVEQSFTDAKEFVDAVSEFYSRNTLMDFLGTGVKRVIFRGIDDASYENLPRAFRFGLHWNRFDFYEPIPLDPTADDAAKANFLFDHRQVELRAVVNFLIASDKLGIPTPLDYFSLDREMDKALGVTKGSKYDYLSRSPHLSHPFPGDEVREAFALAQHYGTPTRFLDWTESPHVAMFFAAADVWKDIQSDVLGSGGHKHVNKSGYITVYGLGGHLVTKLGLILMNATRYQNPRLRAQAGVFVRDPYSDVYFMKEGRWPSLEDRVRVLEAKEKNIKMRGLSPEARLVKWNLIASESTKLTQLLLDFNVSFETMFPSLESAALAFAYRQKILPRH